jgi:hypothetical protein
LKALLILASAIILALTSSQLFSHVNTNILSNSSCSSHQVSILIARINSSSYNILLSYKYPLLAGCFSDLEIVFVLSVSLKLFKSGILYHSILPSFCKLEASN